MALYTWDPIASFEARQINSVEDMNAWLESLTQNEIGPKDDYTFSDFEVLVDGNRFALAYTVTSQVDGTWQTQSEWFPFGYWAIVDRVAIRFPWFENDENFNRRFQPYPG